MTPWGRLPTMGGSRCGPGLTPRRSVRRGGSRARRRVRGPKRVCLVKPDIFSMFVEKAVDELPEEFRRNLGNVEVIIDDYADEEILGALDIDSPLGLLGLYTGTPIDQQSFFAPFLQPGRIYLYREPILFVSRDSEELLENIRDVIVHEIGHHFGFDEDELDCIES